MLFGAQPCKSPIMIGAVSYLTYDFVSFPTQEADTLDLQVKESLAESELRTAHLPAHGKPRALTSSSAVCAYRLDPKGSP